MLLFVAILVLALPAPMAAMATMPMDAMATMPAGTWMQVPAPKLYYFDFPGKAAGLRLAAAHGGIEIDDHRLSRDDLTAMKDSGELPYGQVPFSRRWGCSHLRLLSLRMCSV